MTVQPDLFAEQVLPGLAYRDGLVTRAEEAELIARIDAEPLAPFRFQGWLGKRLTISFGWRYDFSDSSFSRTDRLPDWLHPIRARAAEAVALAPELFAQALLIRYDPGAGIGWHRDKPVFEHVLGISLGAPARLRLRRRIHSGFERRFLELAPRSIYHLSAEARHDWEHSIAPMEVTRWSITFRSLSALGLARSGG